jgi:FeS assembly SUF system protein
MRETADGTWEHRPGRREVVNDMANGMTLEREQIMDALRQCYDPEIPINIVDLGLIYDVQRDDAGNVAVKMTLTSQSCPAAQQIPAQVKTKIGSIAGVGDVKVDIVWDPEWNPSMISESGKQTLGLVEPT